jgi:N-hydroxyarylamine O-acetyltransferase
MSGRDFDLNEYLTRVGHAGRREPTLAVLRDIVAAHAATIPFENIDVFTRRGVSLDARALQRKMVQARRGGYCFEQNSLLREALLALGFEVTGLMARVVRGMDADAITQRTHMMLRVDLPEGPHVADVGFGNLTPTAPLALAPQEYETRHERYRLAPLRDEWLLQAWLAQEWANIYRFALQPQFEIDYDVGHWFTSTRPGSLFVENLIVARPGEACRLTLFNRHFAVRHLDGRTERRELHDAGDFRTTLTEAFGLALDNDEVALLMGALEERPGSGAPHAFFA